MVDNEDFIVDGDEDDDHATTTTSTTINITIS